MILALLLAGWLGVPDPGWGITNQPGPVTLKVFPGQSIPNPLPAGAVVELQPGTHTKAYEALRCAGTEANPAFVTGPTDPQLGVFLMTATVSGKFDLVGEYCIVQGLRFTGNDIAILAASSATHHVWHRDSEVVGTLTKGGATLSSWGPELSNVGLVRMNIHDSGDVNLPIGPTTDQDRHGVSIGGSNVHHVWLLDSKITRSSGDGLQINGGQAWPQGARVHHIYVSGNEVWDNRQSGLSTKGSEHVIFSRNHVYNHKRHCATPGAPPPPGIGYQYDQRSFTVVGNNIHDNCEGIRSASGSAAGGRRDIYILGNFIHDNVQVGYRPNGEHSGIHLVAHNTIVGNPIAIQTNAYGTSLNSPRVSSNSMTGTINCTPGLCPTVVFNPAPGSPTQDAGEPTTAYATFQSLYGLDIAFDRFGVHRPQGTAWDAGDVEMAGPGPSPTPPPVSPTPPASPSPSPSPSTSPTPPPPSPSPSPSPTPCPTCLAPSFSFPPCPGGSSTAQVVSTTTLPGGRVKRVLEVSTAASSCRIEVFSDQ